MRKNMVSALIAPVMLCGVITVASSMAQAVVPTSLQNPIVKLNVVGGTLVTHTVNGYTTQAIVNPFVTDTATGAQSLFSMGGMVETPFGGGGMQMNLFNVNDVLNGLKTAGKAVINNRCSIMQVGQVANGIAGQLAPTNQNVAISNVVTNTASQIMGCN